MTRHDKERGLGTRGLPVPQATRRELVVTAGTPRLLSRIAQDASSALARLDLPQTAKVWRIGSLEFCDEDYQQLVRWLGAIRKGEGPRTLEDLVDYIGAN